jgi:hypothetical protein
MSTQIVTQPAPAEAIQLNDVEWAGEFTTGKALWQAGQPISACVGDVQRHGWLTAKLDEAAGADAYFTAMCDQEDAGESVDWEAVGEVYYNHYGDRVY